MKLKLFFPFLLLFAISISSCTHKTFISKYNAAILDEVKAGQSMTAKLYSDAIANTDKSYSASEENYELLSAFVTSLQDKEAARPKSALLVAIVNNIQTALNDARIHHRSKGTLNNAEFEQFQQALNRQWKSLYNSERNLPK